MDYGKKFIIIGNPNAITYKEIFPLIKENKLWLGNKSMGTDMLFHITNEFAEILKSTKKEGSGYKIQNGEVLGKAMAIWFTNIPHSKQNTPIDLYKRYSNEYPKYDNYDAIEVSKVAEIPADYNGVMGVPITFLDSYCPEQFEIVGNEYSENIERGRVYVNGKRMYSRIFIKKVF